MLVCDIYISGTCCFHFGAGRDGAASEMAEWLYYNVVTAIFHLIFLVFASFSSPLGVMGMRGELSSKITEIDT